MSLAMRNPVVKACAPRPVTARLPSVVCHAINSNTEHRKVDTLSLVGAVVVSASLLLSPAAFADEDAPLSPYEQRQLEMQRRRDLLRQAREKAEQKNQEAAAGTTAAAAAAQADEEVEAGNAARRFDTPKKLNTDSYNQEAAKGFKAPPANPYEGSPLNFSLPPPPEKLSDIKVPDISGFKFEAPSFQLPKFDAPEPAPEPAAPAPAPAPVFRVTPAPPPPAPVTPAPKPEPVKAAPVKAEEPTKPGKRKGPLPLALAEIVVLGLFAGVGLALTKYNDQTTQAVSAAGKLIVTGYNKLEEAVAKK